MPKEIKVELAKKNLRPPPSKLTGLNCAENGQLLIEKLKSLACQIMDGIEQDVGESSPGKSENSLECDEGSSQVLYFFFLIFK